METKNGLIVWWARIFLYLRALIAQETAHVLTPEGMSVALRAAIDASIMALA